MVQALAAGTSRRLTWVWCLAALLATSPLPVMAQADAKKADAKKVDAKKVDAKKADAKKVDAKKADAKKADAKEVDEDAAVKPEGSGVVDSVKIKRKDAVDLFKDPRAEKAMANTFTEFPYPQVRMLSTADRSALKNMAAGLQVPDPALITRAVDIQVAEMTSRKNIKYVIDPPPDAKPRTEALRAIEKASQTLIDLLVTAKEKKNQTFLNAYRQILFAKLQPLFTNHLYARVQAGIILAMAATPATIEVFTKQLNDPNQVVWVKLWAARGLSYATEDGRITLDVVKGTTAAQALVQFLEKEPNAPWPVKIRVLEALGNIRLPSTGGPQGKPDVIATVVRFMADPKEKLEVRAWAAWSIGMIPVPGSQASFNFSLVAYEIGALASEIGNKVASEFDLHEESFAKTSDYARFLTGLLIYQVSPALNGESDVQNTGLLKMRHAALAPAQPILKGLDEQVRELNRSSIELLNSAGANIKKQRKNLGDRLTAFTAFLEKNKPSDTILYPGGPTLSIGPAAQVAGGPDPAK